MRVWAEITEPRSNVVALRPRINPHHPSVRSGGRWLSDTQLQLIASTLQHPTPDGVKAAIELLMGES
jgi:hypothetical protein